MSGDRRNQGQGRPPTPSGGGGQGDRFTQHLKPPETPVRYFQANDQKAPDSTLFGKEAEEEARKLAEVPASQLRRFYAEVMALKRRAELTDISDAEIVAQLSLLRAKAAYTAARQGRDADKRDADKRDAGKRDAFFNLVAFFNRHAHSVKTKNDFLRGFQPHFEAVMAFHKVFDEKKGNAA